MAIFGIEKINPKEAFIVTIDDRPVVGPDNQDLIFYRRKDAERFVEEYSKDENTITEAGE